MFCGRLQAPLILDRKVPVATNSKQSMTKRTGRPSGSGAAMVVASTVLMLLALIAVVLILLLGASAEVVTSRQDIVAAEPGTKSTSSPVSLRMRGRSADDDDDDDGPSPLDSAVAASSAVLAILPDTQYYSEGAPYIFASQTEWLASQNLVKIPLVIHVGDLVQNPAANEEWETADAAMRTLEHVGLPYIISTGNHDLQSWQRNDADRDPAVELYQRHFNATRSAKASPSTFVGRDETGYSEYHLVEMTDGVTVGVMALDWRPSDQTLGEAQSMLDGEWATTPVILVSHEYLYPTMNGKRTDSNNNTATRSVYGEWLWDKLIRNNDQIFLVVCGHVPGTGYRMDENKFNHSVMSVLVDYQERHAGGNGYMRLMELDFGRGAVRHVSFSPFVVQLYHQGGQTRLGPEDYAELIGPTDEFVVEFDFRQRFQQISGAITSEWRERQVPHDPTSFLLDPVKSMLADIPMPNVSRPLPADAEDYPQVAETLAHWRFDGDNRTNGTPVDVDAVIWDLSGSGNDLHREDATSNADGYLTWSADHHQLSSSPGSVCFSNPDRDDGSFLTTGADVPLSGKIFDDGFTIEAFVKLNPHWDGAHRWSGVISRAGEGQDAGKTEGDVKEPLAVWCHPVF